MLIKFFRPEHVKDFLNGKLYFRNAGYFIDLEAQSGEKGIGDKYEGSFFRAFDPKTQEIQIVLKDEMKIPLNIKKAYFTERYEAARQFQLTCFTGFTYEDVEKVSENELKIKDELIEGLKKEFPERVPVLILNEPEFFERVSKTLNEMGIGALHGYVKYFDEYAMSPLEETEYEEDITKAFFYKRDYFKGQREYRIITRQPVDDDSLTINLGDIRDLVYNLENNDNFDTFRLQIINK